MVSRYEVTLNNNRLAYVDSSILIHDVQYEKPQYSRNLFQIADRQGARIGKVYKQRAAVTITFEIRKYDIKDRQEVLEKIIRWARNGGDLRINDRPYQKLVCVCDELPSIESVRDWTGELSMTFAAYAIPYWQKTTNNNIVINYSSHAETTVKDDIFQEATIPTVSGNAPYIYPELVLINDFAYSQVAPTVYLEMENTSRNDGKFAVSTPLTQASSQEIRMAYDENQIMTLKYTGGSSVYNLQGRMTGIDDFKISTGQNNTIKFAFYRSYVDGNTGHIVYVPTDCTAVIVYRGCWE